MSLQLYPIQRNIRRARVADAQRNQRHTWKVVINLQFQAFPPGSFPGLCRLSPRAFPTLPVFQTYHALLLRPGRSAPRHAPSSLPK